jgi:glycerol-3-phosphate cytidylyltransferase-like family protein
MRLFDLFENENTNLIVVYPGRFHPFHVGHGKVFQYLKQKYKGAQVFIASSGKTDAHKSPFAFDEKKKMMMLAGVDPNSIVQTRIPYVASEITDRFDPDTTVVVYAVSEKDMAEDARFDFPAVGKKLKKDGDPAHVQKWTGIKDARPLREHSYIVTVPTFTFKIRGEAVNSATQIRNMIANADERELVQILQDLYGRADIPHDVVEIFKRKLGSDTVSENWEEENLFELLLEAELHREVLSETVSSKNNYNNFINKYEIDATQLMDAEEEEKGFDPKTVNALKNLKVKYPHADNVMSALVADVEDSQRISKEKDTEHDIGIAALEDKIDQLMQELQKLKKTEESTMRIDDIINEEITLTEDITLEDHEDFHEHFGDLAFCEDGMFEAEYQGRTVKLNKPMQGDTKKFKVYVKNPKGNVVKVNFGHGGTSAKGKTMKIRKSNPKARKSFRARHNCENPGPKHKARYWSCRKW